MTARTFTLDELDALIADATPGPWFLTERDGPWGADVVQIGTDRAICGEEPQRRADARIIAAAPDLAAFARELLTERETAARLHRQQVERIEDDAAGLAAECDALRATVDRLRPVVEALATWMDDEAQRPGDEETAYDAWDRAVTAVTLAVGLPAKRWQETTPALRALLADAPAGDIGDALERGADADAAMLDALGIVPAASEVPDV